MQSVKTVVSLRKRSHNWFSPRLWSEVNNTCRRSYTQRSVSWSRPVVSMRSKPKVGGRRVKKSVTQGRSKLGLWINRIFNIIIVCLCLSVEKALEKRVDCWHWKRT